MTEYLEEFETRGEEAAIRSGLALSASSLSWHLIKGAKLTPLQRLLLMGQVGGDLRRYRDIRFFLKKMFPFDGAHPLIGYADESPGGAGLQDRTELVVGRGGTQRIAAATTAGRW